MVTNWHWRCVLRDLQKHRDLHDARQETFYVVTTNVCHYITIGNGFYFTSNICLVDGVIVSTASTTHFT